MTTPTHAEILALWQDTWPERLPHPVGLTQRLTNPEQWLWRRDSTGKLVAFAAYAPPEFHAFGYIRLLLVHPGAQRRGLGRELVAGAQKRLGNVRVSLGEERGHFFPGVPESSREFWQKSGFSSTGGSCVDMRCDLREPLPLPKLPASLRVTDARESGVQQGVLDLTREVFSPRWTADTEHVSHSPQQVLALLEGRRVLGFALTGLETDPLILPSFLYPAALKHSWDTGALAGGLGPIGIHPSVRGSGLGRAFMLAAMHRLQGRGARVMGIDWTGIAPFYEKLGFERWATYGHMRGSD